MWGTNPGTALVTWLSVTNARSGSTRDARTSPLMPLNVLLALQFLLLATCERCSYTMLCSYSFNGVLALIWHTVVTNVNALLSKQFTVRMDGTLASPKRFAMVKNHPRIQEHVW